MAPSILLLDDDANFRRTLRIALTLESVRVAEAGTIDEARKLIDARHYDCVVVNLLTGGEDARRLLEWVRKRHPATTRVACSVHPELIRPYALLDPDAIALEKPFSPERLLDATGLGSRPAPGLGALSSAPGAFLRLRNGR